MSPIEIIAHRGASRERPENTISAFQRAVELGADGVELDVHLTADGILAHHGWAPRGPGDSASVGPTIRSLTSEQLRAFRVDGEGIPTLEEVIRVVGGRVTVYCELKGRETAAPAVKLLEPLGPRAAVHAFDHRQIAVARRLAPAVPRGVLEASYHLAPTASMESVDARLLWMDAALIERRSSPLAVHSHGGRIPGRGRSTSQNEKCGGLAAPRRGRTCART